jgi:adenine phosphoribosyltransferase
MDLKTLIADVPDFPRPGILFRDVSPLLADARGFATAVRALAAAVADLEFGPVAGIEARGFIFGAALAQHLGRGFLPVRKHGKLPGEVHRASYALEYGEDVLELRAGIVAAGTPVLLVDDVLATGGTLDAARRLTVAAGLRPVGAAVLVELESLAGRARLGDGLPVRAVLRY